MNIVMKTAVICLLLGAACVVSFFVGRSSNRYDLNLRYSAQTEVIEAYRSGELVYEVQPTDGSLYSELVSIIEDREALPVPEKNGGIIQLVQFGGRVR